MKCVSCKVLKVRSELAGEVACGTHVVCVSVLLLSGIDAVERKMPQEKLVVFHILLRRAVEKIIPRFPANFSKYFMETSRTK